LEEILTMALHEIHVRSKDAVLVEPNDEADRIDVAHADKHLPAELIDDERVGIVLIT